MNIPEILQKAVALDAADVFLIAGLPVTFKCGGRQQRMENGVLMPDEIGALAEEVYALSKRSRANFERGADDDFSFAVPGLGRFRVNIFRQRGSPAAVIRVIRFGLPDPARLGIPESVLSLAENKKGLVLITGSAGTGKSTTLACMIDRINKTRDCHIITMEDPIEYIHRHDKAIVTQREISIDTPGYLESLRSALRESPDVILLGEMRDYDTISAAITAAETGVLLLSTLHTSSAANTISRILDVFPAAQQKQVKIQLAQILKGVVCQQLVPSVDGAQIPVFEILKPTVAIQNMIREDKLHQLESAMQAGAAEGMCTMDGSLLKLCMEGRITRDTALLSCVNYETMAKRLRM
ncbi:MAG: PilT/PilU family type 4a pilus ATPase [Oscillospiraceae bacterium]|nr:PilT/PilU family type 4a pilus ATPase [Oscillospiraceae bacterium]